jgi:hypothetical protein
MAAIYIPPRLRTGADYRASLRAEIEAHSKATLIPRRESDSMTKYTA